MSPTNEDIKAYLLKAITSTARMSTYASLLGFRKLSTAKRHCGPPAYTEPVRKFYAAAKEIADELSKEYKLAADLRAKIEAQERFTESRIDDLMQQYGSVIWNDGKSPFVTIIDDEKVSGVGNAYPRHLIYDNESDRIRLVVDAIPMSWRTKLTYFQSIRTFVYCLILQRTGRNLRNSGVQFSDDADIQRELPRTVPGGSRARRSKAMATNPNTVSVRSREIVPTTVASSDTSESGSLRDPCEYQIPVAQMVSTNNTQGPSPFSTISQPNSGEAPFTRRNDFAVTEDRYQPNETSQSCSLPMRLSPLDQASNLNSGQSEETRRRRPLRKRRRDPQEEEEEEADMTFDLSEFTGRSVHPRRGLTYNISRSPSPVVTPDVLDNSAHQKPRDVSSNRTEGHNANEMASIRYQSRVETDIDDDSDNDDFVITGVTTLHFYSPTANVHTSDDSLGEVDSVTGPPRLSPAEQERDGGHEPTLIVKLKIQSQEDIRQRESLRTDLTDRLLSFFEMSCEQPKALEEMVTLIKNIRELDNPLSRSRPRSRQASYQLVLNQWLELVNIYLRLRKGIESKNDQRTETTHRDSIDFNQGFKKHRIMNAARREIRAWSSKYKNHETCEWSKCATSILVEMAYWEMDVNREEMEDMRKRFVKFNESLIKGRLPLLLS